MAQISESLVREILAGAGITRGEIEQLCHYYLNGQASRAVVPSVAVQEGYAAIGHRLRADFIEARHALQFANDNPGGGINDTIWMPERPETLFDFMDATIEAIAKQEGSDNDR